MGVKGQSLTAEDQMLILTQAGFYLSTTRGLGVPEARICYERAECLCHSLNRPMLLYSALIGQWRHSLLTDKLNATMQIANRLYSLVQERNDSALMLGAYRALAGTLYYSGDFEIARQYAQRGVRIWRSGCVQRSLEEIHAPAVSCLCYEALTEWHIGGGTASCQMTVAEAISLAKELNDMHALAVALWHAGRLAHFEGKPGKVERFASDLVELSTRQNFALWLAGGEVLSGWAHSASKNAMQGLAWIQDGIVGWRATGSMLLIPYYLGIMAEALHIADRTSEALEAISEAEAMIERSGERWWYAELYRLRGVFLAAIGADENQIDTSFLEAIRIAKEQKSTSLATRAETTYAEYRRGRGKALEGTG
jgi:adenylate cyclase